MKNPTFYIYPSPTKKQTITRICISVLVIVLFLLAIYLPFQLSGSLDKITSVNELKELILSCGVWSYLAFAMLQFLQVTFIPLPSAITTLAGTMIFGSIISFGISYVFIMLGCLFAFVLGRKVGKRVLFWVAGKRQGSVYINKLSKGKYAFFLMLLFPFFPDDILCMAAGVTNMSYTFFIVANLISRAVGLIPICFLGSGELIPFSGWGIPVWCALLVVVIILFILSIKYQSKLENWFAAINKKLTKDKIETKDIVEHKQILKDKSKVLHNKPLTELIKNITPKEKKLKAKSKK